MVPTHQYFFYSRWPKPSTVVEKVDLQISCPFWIPPTFTKPAERVTPQGDDDFTYRADILESHDIKYKNKEKYISSLN